MRLAGMLGVLCFAVAPAFGGAVDYTFEVVSGTLTLDVSPDGVASPDPVVVDVEGTFGMTIYQQGDMHIASSDTFTVGVADITNTGELELNLMGLATARIGIGSARFAQFAPATPGHIPPGGQGSIDTDVFVEVVAIVTGLLNTTLDTKTWAEEVLTFPLSITTSVQGSGIATVSLGGSFGYEIGVSAITQTLTLDLIINIVGTAHVVPDPALGGLAALGLGGAGAWIRRRSG